MSVTRPATERELIWIAPAAISSHVVSGVRELLTIAREAPWRVRVSTRGEAAILGRWREHLDDCAVLGLWCAGERVPVLVPDLCEVASEQGFGRLLGPLVPESVVRPYLTAGLRRLESIVVMRVQTADRAVEAPAAPSAVRLRRATVDDVAPIARVDAACFDDFWRYDPCALERYLEQERAAVALAEDGTVIGYTLATVREREGTLGRLAVHPTSRGAHVGTALACEALRWMARRGVRAVTLSTQETNAISRRLYRKLGFRELDEVLVVTASERLRPLQDGT